MAKPTPIAEILPTAIPEPSATASRRSGPAVNRVILIGRLTGDPELRFTSSGLAVANIRLVTNDREVPEYHDVVLWRQLAETAGKYLVKGRLVYVEGHLRGRTWTAQDGATRRSVEIVGENVQFLSSRAARAEEG
jgi:single-strand DNA-binding protein